jgi:PadR family transcriptional regulator PadR
VQAKRSSAKRSAIAAHKAVVEATRGGKATTGFAPAGRPSDVFGGELRRRDVFSLLVLHLIDHSESGTSYGNQLIEQIETLTLGVVSLNPNTIYPLLRDLETRGLVKGEWEHPEKRSRRLYRITKSGKAEYERLREALEPFLDSIVNSIVLIKRAVYGSGNRKPPATRAKRR